MELADLAGDRWMVDPTVDGEWDGVRRVWARPASTRRSCTAITSPPLPSSPSGEAVAPCQPTSGPRDDMAIRPLRDDPLAVRLLLFSRPDAYEDAGPAVGAEVYADLEAAYREAALRVVGYRQWLPHHKSPLLHTPAA